MLTFQVRGLGVESGYSQVASQMSQGRLVLLKARVVAGQSQFMDGSIDFKSKLGIRRLSLADEYYELLVR